MCSLKRKNMVQRLLVTISMVALISVPALATKYTLTITINGTTCTQSPAQLFQINEKDTVVWTSGDPKKNIEVTFPSSHDSGWPNTPFLKRDGTWERSFTGAGSTQETSGAQLTPEERSASPVQFYYSAVKVDGANCNNATTLGVEIPKH